MTVTAPAPAVPNKVMPVAEAVARLVRPGMTLHLAFGDARPNATVREVVRRFRGTRPGFTVVTSGLLSTQQALVGAGLVDRLVTSFAGENYPAPQPSPVIHRALEDGSLTIEDWTLYTLVARLAAGALGVPFFPVRSLRDGSLSGRSDAGVRAQVADPFDPDGEPVTVVPRLNPDLTFVHGVVGDTDGNVALAGATGESGWGALAATSGVIATVERIVTPEELRAANAVVKIPASVVTAICPAPGGSHPYGLYSGGLAGVDGYDEDAAYVGTVRVAMATRESFGAWIDRWLATDDRPAGPAAREPVAHPAGHSDAELMIVTAARRLVRRVTADGFRTVLAGIGQANLAAWLAHDELRDGPHRVELLAEMGMVGYQPQEGDSYLFANRNKPGAAQLTDTMAVLGAYVGHPKVRTLAAVGAGQVDALGDINSSVGYDGRYLTGSGGANDIASVAAELLVVLKQSPKRLVERVPVRTAPGRAVGTIVTDRAVFERGPDGFVLTSVLVPSGSEDTATPELVAEVRRRSGWTSVTWPEEVEREAPPTADELAALRAYDPQRYFLR